MSIDYAAAYQEKRRLGEKLNKIRARMEPTQKRFEKLARDTGTKPVFVYFDDDAVHVLERAEQRWIKSKYIQRALERLMEYYYCELLYLFECNVGKFERGEVTTSTFQLGVASENCTIILKCKNAPGSYKMLLKTVLKKDMKPTVDYMFDTTDEYIENKVSSLVEPNVNNVNFVVSMEK